MAQQIKSDATDFVRGALHGRLEGAIRADLANAGAILAVHDGTAPDGTRMPYLRLSAFRMTDAGGAAVGGGYHGSQEIRGQVDVYTREPNDTRVCERVKRRVVEHLADELTLPPPEPGARYAGSAVLRQVEGSRTLEEDDGDVQHGVVEVFIRVQLHAS